MIRLTFLGTCSGTEPMPNHHHSSIVLEINDQSYWFDAGENCSHKAYTSGIDVSRIRAVFISHMHIDHIGGLANLLFTICKVALMTNQPHTNGNSYDVFVPDPQKYQSVKDVSGVFHSDGTAIRVQSVEHELSDGVVFEDENLRVTALHNTHLKENGENGWHSYSFLIEADGRRIVYSGDVRHPTELDPYMTDGADLLIMETGHHSVADVCTYASTKGAKQLLLTHHGREILRDADAAARLAASLHPNVKICNDGDTVLL